MKKNYTLLTAFLLITLTCGCTNPIAKFKEFRMNNTELIEIENEDYTYTYKNKAGDVIFDKITQLYFVDNAAVISKDGKFGIVNKAGDYIVEPIYDYITNFKDGMSAFFIEDISGTTKIGYFNTKGEVAIEPIPADLSLFSGYSYDYNFYNGIAMYRDPQNQKYGFIDKKGNFVVDVKYDWAAPFKGKLAPVCNKTKCGYINTLGELVIPYKYVYAEIFSDGLAAVFNGQTWGYIDETGKYVIPSQYGSFEGHDGEYIANPFVEGYAGVYLGKGQAWHMDIHKGQFAIIDKTGKILNGQKYDSLDFGYFEPGKASYRVSLNGKTMILDAKGNVKKEY